MKCRKCGKEMKIICSSSRSGRGGYSSGSIFKCECGESCLVEGLHVNWGDRYKEQREQLRKRLEAYSKKKPDRFKEVLKNNPPSNRPFDIEIKHNQIITDQDLEEYQFQRFKFEKERKRNEN